MSPAEFLEFAKRCAVQGRVRLSSHAEVESLPRRHIQAADVRSALESATKASPQAGSDKWKLEGGKDLDGDDLTVIAAAEGDGLRIVIVTAF
ncbi:MAG: DUF4258 domain-containing protein [Polyangiales bacterium]